MGELARALRRVLHGRGWQLLDYGDAAGDARLRRALTVFLAEQRGLVWDPDELLITQGSQQAICLCARVLCQPGS